MRHHELACQPILLLMLAIYDADNNGLHPQSQSLGRASLYERLLVSFVKRELLKDGNPADESMLSMRVEAELYHLSVVAYGMFNRGVQAIREGELNRDFEALRIERVMAVPTGEFYSSLTPAEKTLGRFFFVHRAEARDEAAESNRQRVMLGRSFEFLHATFGEYLVARCTLKVIEEAGAGLGAPKAWDSEQLIAHEALLAALLSFQSFSKRFQIISFITEIAESMDEAKRQSGVTVCRMLLGRSIWPLNDSRYDQYVPIVLDSITRSAVFSVNLVLICVALMGSVPLEDIAPTDSASSLAWWRRSALVWQSRLDREAWIVLTQTIMLRTYDRQEFFVSFRTQEDMPYQSALISRVPIEIYGFCGPNGEVSLGGTFRAIRVADMLENERLISEFLLDHTGVLNAELACYLRDELGDIGETVIFPPHSEFEPDTFVTTLDRPAVPGAVIFALLAFESYDDIATLKTLFSLGLELVDISRAPLYSSQARAITCLLNVADRELKHLDRSQVLKLLSMGISYRPTEADFNYYGRLIRLWFGLNRIEPFESDSQFPQFPADVRDQLVTDPREMITVMIARLDPLHAIGAHTTEMMELLIDATESGINISDIASEFGSMYAILNGIDLASISRDRQALAVRILQFVVDQGVSDWIDDFGLANIVAFSDQAFALIPDLYLSFFASRYDPNRVDISRYNPDRVGTSRYDPDRVDVEHDWHSPVSRDELWRMFLERSRARGIEV